ncbi:MAG: LysR family transcriptional regulator [Faecalibacillus sp.]
MKRMYNHQLDTFIAVADAGSFNKASEKLYISPNAVMKQINLLERNLGFSLFQRSHQGLKLSPAGKSLYDDSQYIIKYSQNAIKKAEKIAYKQHIIRIGVSFTTPVEFLLSLCMKVQQIHPKLKFELISFENTPQNAKEIMENFGKNIDMVAGVYSDNLLKKRNCLAYHLYDAPICCAVPRSHPLSLQDQLKIEDLFDEKVMLLQHHYMDDFDKIRIDLMTKYPHMHIEDIEFFNMNVFNQCVNENKILIAVHEWKNIHPMLKMIPVDWNYQISFGIMYSPQPSHEINLLLSTLKQISHEYKR